jgi:hypothetical protein
MTVTYGFYDSVTGDRVYNAMQFSSLLDSIIRDGVFLSIGQAFAVSPGTGLHVQVGSGRAWFDHTWTYNDYAITLDVTTPHALLDRIDTVVLETNSEQATRANSIKVIAGTPASSPVPPTLTHTSTVNQYPLADIFVGNTVTEFVQADITNRVGTSDCPFVTGILETIDIDFIFAQWQDDFETWFTFLQDELDENQAANLQAQILEHDHSDPLQTLIPTGGLMDGAVSLLKLAATLRFQKLFEFAGDGVNHLDWSSIPNTFTHLLLIYNGLSSRTSAGWDYIWLRANNDSGANYFTSLYLNQGSIPAMEQWQYNITNPHAMGLHAGMLPAQNADFLPSGSGIILLPNYKGTTLYKTAIHLSSWFGTYSYGFAIASSYWANTAAINRLTSNMSSTYKPRTGSLFSLYGFN